VWVACDEGATPPASDTDNKAARAKNSTARAFPPRQLLKNARARLTSPPSSLSRLPDVDGWGAAMASERGHMV